MPEDSIKNSIQALISRVSSITALSSASLGGTMFPDHTIAALHNHLGNISHMTDDSSAAFNATDQALAFSGALRELGEVEENLLALHQTEHLTDSEYQFVSERVYELKEKLKAAEDPEEYS